MEKEKYICPLSEKECKEKKCAWYVVGLNECAVNSIAQAINYQAEMISEIKDYDN